MSTTPVKEKLIQLFKQCSNSSEFVKEKNLKSFTPKNVENAGFTLPDYPVLEMKFSSIKTFSLGRIFEFSSQPPLILCNADVEIMANIKKEHLIFHELETIETQYSPIHEKKTFMELSWGFQVKPPVYRKLKVRRIEIKEKALNELSKLREWTPAKNKCYVGGDYYPNMAYPNRDNDLLKERFENSVIQNCTAFTTEELRKIENYSFRFGVRGGLLIFGEISTWLTSEEYSKLNDLYLQGLLKSHEELLNKRLEETYDI